MSSQYRVEILGPACDHSARLEANVRAAATRAGIEADYARVSDALEIARRGVLAVPALVIDGRLISTGQVPTVERLARLFATPG